MPKVTEESIRIWEEQKDIEQLVNSLRDHDDWIGFQVYKALKRTANEKTIELLIKALKDKDHVLSTRAAVALNDVAEQAVQTAGEVPVDLLLVALKAIPFK